MKYLTDALDLIQTKSYYASRVENWEVLRAKALDMATDAQTPADCYPAIRMVMDTINDNHSRFIGADEKGTSGFGGQPVATGMSVLLPEGIVSEICPGSAADRAGIKRWDMIESVNGEALKLGPDGRRAKFGTDPYRAIVRREGQTFEVEIEPTPLENMPLPHGYMLEGHIGYIELFLQVSQEQTRDYADLVQQVIRENLDKGANAWIVDLRCNRGGNMWPMIAGTGPLIGDGEIGSFIHNHNNQPPVTWHYHNGASLYKKVDMEQPEAITTASNPVPTLDSTTTPVAVLTGEFTASSGEMALVAFRGRPNLRTFGGSTMALTTAVAMHDLEDGAILALAESVCADRTGTIYDSAIAPDEEVKTDWLHYGQSDDPVIQAAVTWLKERLG